MPCCRTTTAPLICLNTIGGLNITQTLLTSAFIYCGGVSNEALLLTWFVPLFLRIACLVSVKPVYSAGMPQTKFLELYIYINRHSFTLCLAPLSGPFCQAISSAHAIVTTQPVLQWERYSIRYCLLHPDVCCGVTVASTDTFHVARSK